MYSTTPSPPPGKIVVTLRTTHISLSSYDCPPAICETFMPLAPLSCLEQPVPGVEARDNEPLEYFSNYDAYPPEDPEEPADRREYDVASKHCPHKVKWGQKAAFENCFRFCLDNTHDDSSYHHEHEYYCSQNRLHTCYPRCCYKENQQKTSRFL